MVNFHVIWNNDASMKLDCQSMRHDCLAFDFDHSVSSARLPSKPHHLEVVSHKENMARATILRTHCKLGHRLDGVRVHTDGWRYCKTCNTEAKRRNRAKMKKK